MQEIKELVQQKFAEIKSALQMREKLLQRQMDVILQQQHAIRSENALVEFLVDAEEEEKLLAAIRSFGRLKLENINLHDVLPKSEDYIEDCDHETMYKCLDGSEHLDESFALDDDEQEQQQGDAIVVDFSKQRSTNTLIDHNAKQSIINITLQEAKELIRKAKAKRDMPIPPLNLEELDDELESSIAEAVSSLSNGASAAIAADEAENCGTPSELAASHKSSQTNLSENSKKSKSKRFKPKITINNCNGTINLRNIASLTINCANEEAVSAQMPLPTPPKQQKSKNNGNNKQFEREEDDESTQYLAYGGAAGGVVSKNSTEHKQQSVISEATTSSSTLVSMESSTDNSTATSSNYSSNASSRSQSKKQKYKKANAQSKSGPPLHASTGDEEQDECDVDAEATVATCDFYNRLLNEIKNSLKTKHGSSYDNAHYIKRTMPKQAAADSTCDANSNVSSSNVSSSLAESTQISTEDKQSSVQQNKRLILRNYENLKIILEANSDEESLQPVQIEQWLAEIISETDQEPVQNTDMLEHSKIHNESAST